MLTRLDSPESVLAFRGTGKIGKVDYEHVLEPAVKDMLASRGEVRFVYVLGDDFEGYTAGAGWEDAKLGMSDFTKWKRCAVATSHDWIRHGVSMFGWMMPGEIKTFDATDVDAAIAWAAA
jgi:hypothetical protein